MARSGVSVLAPSGSVLASRPTHFELPEVAVCGIAMPAFSSPQHRNANNTTPFRGTDKRSAEFGRSPAMEPVDIWRSVKHDPPTIRAVSDRVSSYRRRPHLSFQLDLRSTKRRNDDPSN